MAAAKRLLVIGSYNRDTVLSVPHFPAPGETLRAGDARGFHGGKGSNQAVQAARFGASVSLIAAIGQDAAGTEAIGLWRAEGIDTALVSRIADAPTGSATILVDRAGENLIVVAPGANDRLPFEVAHEEAIAGASIVLAQLETPAEATIAAFACARRHGVRTMLNAAPMPDRVPVGLLELTDIVAVNAIEAAMLVRALGAEDAPEALLDHVAEAVLLTQGSRGATLYRRDCTPLAQPAPHIEAVDTTGAGDALTGAFAAQLAATGDWAAALGWGVAAGAHACTVAGAVPSFGGPDAIAAFLAAGASA